MIKLRKKEKLDTKENIALEIKITAGSAENLKLLEADPDGVDIAFVQGSMAHWPKPKTSFHWAASILNLCGFFIKTTSYF